jgi:TP901 family phage tail tape measure protein
MAADSTINIEIELQQALRKLDELQKAFDKQSELIDQASKSASRFERVIKKSMTSATKAVKSATSVFLNLKSAAVGIVAAFSAREFVNFGANYERQISKLNALTQASQTEQLRLRKAIREVGSSTAYTATQAAEAANVLAALGRSSNQISKELGVVVKVAGATGTAIETVSEAVAAQMNVFGESAEQVGNVFAAAYSTSAANVEKLQTALGQVGPVAKAAGLSLTQTAGAISFLVDRGFRAEAAGTALRGVLVRLIDPTKVVLKEFDALGISFEQIQKLSFQDQMQAIADRLGNVASQAERNRILTKIFGVEALAAANNFINALQEGNQVIDSQAQKLRQATTAADLYKEITSDLRGSIDNLISAVQDKLLTAFQAAEPFVQGIVDKLKEAVQALTAEDIIDAVENIGIKLVKGAFAFYDAIRVAINAVYSFFNSAAFQNVIEVAKNAVSALGYSSIDDQIRKAEDDLRFYITKVAEISQQQRDDRDSLFPSFIKGDSLQEAQQELEIAKQVLAELQKQKTEQALSLEIVKDRSGLEQFLIDKIREGATKIRERLKAQENITDAVEKQVTATKDLAEAEETLPSQKKSPFAALTGAGGGGETFTPPPQIEGLVDAYTALSQSLTVAFEKAFDESEPLAERASELTDFVFSINKGLEAVEKQGTFDPQQMKVIQSVLVEMLVLAKELDRDAQSEALGEANKKANELAATIKKLDDARAEASEKTRREQEKIAAAIAEQTRLQNHTFFDSIVKSVKEILGYEEDITGEKLKQNDYDKWRLQQAEKYKDVLANTLVEGVAGAGPNASRGISAGKAFAQGAQAGGPMAGLANMALDMVMSNEKVAKAIDGTFKLFFDVFDPFIGLIGDLIEAINRLIGALIKNITSGIEGALDQIGLGPNGYLFGGGFAQDFEQFTFDISGGMFGVDNTRDYDLTGDDVVNAQKQLLANVFEDIETVFDEGFREHSSDPQYRGLLDTNGRFRTQFNLTAETIEDFVSQVERVGFEEALEGTTGAMQGAFDSISSMYINGYDKDKLRRNAEEVKTILTELLTDAYFDVLSQDFIDEIDSMRAGIFSELESIRFNSLSPEQQINEQSHERLDAIDAERDKVNELITSEEHRITLLDHLDDLEADSNRLLAAQTLQLKLLNEERERDLFLMQSSNMMNTIGQILSNFDATMIRIGELVEGLFDQVNELLFSDFNLAPNTEKFELATQKYQQLLEAAFDPDASEEDIENVQAFVNEYLKSARDVYKSSSTFQQIFASVLDDLSMLGVTTGFNQTGGAVSDATSEIEEFIAATEDLDEGLKDALDKVTRELGLLAVAFQEQQLDFIIGEEGLNIPLEIDGSNLKPIISPSIDLALTQDDIGSIGFFDENGDPLKLDFTEAASFTANISGFYSQDTETYPDATRTESSTFTANVTGFDDYTGEASVDVTLTGFEDVTATATLTPVLTGFEEYNPKASVNPTFTGFQTYNEAADFNATLTGWTEYTGEATFDGDITVNSDFKVALTNWKTISQDGLTATSDVSVSSTLTKTTTGWTDVIRNANFSYSANNWGNVYRTSNFYGTANNWSNVYKTANFSYTASGWGEFSRSATFSFTTNLQTEVNNLTDAIRQAVVDAAYDLAQIDVSGGGSIGGGGSDGGNTGSQYPIGTGGGELMDRYYEGSTGHSFNRISNSLGFENIYYYTGQQGESNRDASYAAAFKTKMIDEGFTYEGHPYLITYDAPNGYNYVYAFKADKLSLAQADWEWYGKNRASQMQYYSKYGFRYGGVVPHPEDTIPAMLSAGEYILSPETVNRFGVRSLNRLNNGDSSALAQTNDPEVKRLLSELIVAVKENGTDVHVYTDMKGEAKAAVSEFRSELKERTRRQGDQYVPAKYI